jgi:hypothetical protein
MDTQEIYDTLESQYFGPAMMSRPRSVPFLSFWRDTSCLWMSAQASASILSLPTKLCVMA